jgi:putative Mg2+ transporter-C (MgtC) family protein
MTNGDIVLRLILAIVLGGLIGLEREISGKPAGLRTNILICVGSTLFMLISIYMFQKFPNSDPGRIAAQVVTGIGFLGAGTILQAKGSIIGLTTAATIWSVSSIGLAIGCGFYFPALVASIAIIFILLIFGRFEAFLDEKVKE